MVTWRTYGECVASRDRACLSSTVSATFGIGITGGALIQNLSRVRADYANDAERVVVGRAYRPRHERRAEATQGQAGAAGCTTPGSKRSDGQRRGGVHRPGPQGAGYWAPAGYVVPGGLRRREVAARLALEAEKRSTRTGPPRHRPSPTCARGTPRRSLRCWR